MDVTSRKGPEKPWILAEPAKAGAGVEGRWGFVVWLDACTCSSLSYDTPSSPMPLIY